MDNSLLAAPDISLICSANWSRPNSMIFSKVKSSAGAQKNSETETETDRERDRQTDRQRQTETETERQREREGGRERERDREVGSAARPRPVKGASREGEESNLQITFTVDGRADSPCDEMSKYFSRNWALSYSSLVLTHPTPPHPESYVFWLAMFKVGFPQIYDARLIFSRPLHWVPFCEGIWDVQNNLDQQSWLCMHRVSSLMSDGAPFKFLPDMCHALWWMCACYSEEKWNVAVVNPGMKDVGDLAGDPPFTAATYTLSTSFLLNCGLD